MKYKAIEYSRLITLASLVAFTPPAMADEPLKGGSSIAELINGKMVSLNGVIWMWSYAGKRISMGDSGQSFQLQNGGPPSQWREIVACAERGTVRSPCSGSLTGELSLEEGDLVVYVTDVRRLKRP